VKAPLHLELQAQEVAWYRKYGKYSDRIKVDAGHHYYVVGDWSWNREQGTKKSEYIEKEMSYGRRFMRID